MTAEKQNSIGQDGACVRPLSFARQALGGALVAGRAPPGAVFAGAVIDSREAKAGQIFFAIKGERVDGYDFGAAAVAAGVVALVVPAGRGAPAGCGDTPVIEVDDPVLALGRLARAARVAFAGKVVGVTGSNGKTTTKELIAAALAPAGTVMRTPGNLNSELGLPLAVLGARGDEDFWVLEMAMRGPGEIAYLGGIAEPHVGVITNIAGAHLGRLGSLEAVARAKGEIFATLGAGGTAIVPAREPRLQPFVEPLGEARVLRFGVAGEGVPPQPEVLARMVTLLDWFPDGAQGSLARIAVAGRPVLARIPLAGQHNALNAAAALAVAHALGQDALQAATGLGQVVLPPHRSRMLQIGGRTILDDCYNANPASMTAALATLASCARGIGRSFAILGDMLELGEESARAHEALGAAAAGMGLTALAAVGPLAREIAAGARRAGLRDVIETDDVLVAAREIGTRARVGDFVLVKASRGGRLERAVEALYKLWPESPR